MARRSRSGRRPFYTRWWFILLVVLLLFGSPSGGKKKAEDRQQQEAVEVVSKSPAPAQNTPEPEQNTPEPEQNAPESEQKAPESEQIAPAVAAASLLTLPEADAGTDAPERSLPAEETPEPTPEPTPAPTPVPTPEPAPQLNTYVLNTNTMKFHRPGCKSVAKMKAANKATVEAAREDLIARGYSPCGNCHP